VSVACVVVVTPVTAVAVWVADVATEVLCVELVDWGLEW